MHSLLFLLFLGLCRTEHNVGSGINAGSELLERVRPEANASCYIRQRSLHDLFIACPTDEICHIKTYFENGTEVLSVPYEADLDAPCESVDQSALPVGKISQLEAVRGVLRLTQEIACEFSSVQTLDAQNNGLSNMGRLGAAGCGNDVSNCTYRLRRLNLSFNKIHNLLDNSFCQFRQLEYLQMDNCLINTIERQAFTQLSNLESLILSRNLLQTLPEQLFHQLKRLVHLDLSHNQLTQLTDFTPLLHLKTLLIHNNSLNGLSFNKLKRLPSLKSISLHSNRFQCDCQFVDSFRAFFLDSEINVDNLRQINCWENGKEFKMLSFNCASNGDAQFYVNVLIATLTTVLLINITAIVIFVYRREIQVLIYASSGFKALRKGQPEVEGKQYDAFVAYNSADSDFLLNELMPGLEVIQNPYRLCIHDRDFPSGSYIHDSILQAINLSSRTIIVLSQNFVNSAWCRFEFNSAHARMLQDQCPRILVILLGEVPENLNPMMKLYLKTNTYLQWGERLFWQKLYYAMPELRVSTPPTDVIPMLNV